MVIGIIGVGNIASSIVTGLCSCKERNLKIILSPRNAEKAEKLAEKYTNVEIASSNQGVADKADCVIISLVPKFAEEIIRNIKFRENQCVISLMTDHKLSDIREWIGKTKVLDRVVPLPFISEKIGPIVIYPGSKEVRELFSPLGEIIEAGNEDILEVFIAITAVMSSYYMLVSRIAGWGENEGIDRDQSVDYTVSFFEALMHMAKNADKGNIEGLAMEMTPGGLNELVLTFIEKHEGFEMWTSALNAVLDRIKK